MHPDRSTVSILMGILLATLFPAAFGCSDMLSSAFCQSKIDSNGLNDDGLPAACYGSGVYQACTGGPGCVDGQVLSGLCPTCGNPGLCDLTCGCFPADAPTIAPTVTPGNPTTSPTLSPAPTLSSAPTPAPTAISEGLISPWLAWALPLTFLFFFALLFLTPSARKNPRSRNTSVAATLIAAALTLGQACKSFDVSYDVGIQAGKEMNYDFYEGVVEMWEKGSPMLSVMLLIFSGIWPFLKQACTIHAISLEDGSARQTTYLQILGVSGKLAFLDIAVVCLIITTMNIPIASKELGITGYVRTFPAAGTLIVIATLIASRVLTSSLLHVFHTSERREATEKRCIR